MGLPFNHDFNGITQEGVGWYQVTQKNGERHSAADAYLHPALKRNNLTTITHAHVTRILFKETLAIGIEYVHENRITHAYVDQEVILCGGAINSPQVLLCSGVGPANQLQQLDIPVVLDLPGVGQNLQDHTKVDLQFSSVLSTSYDFSLNNDAYAEYIQYKTGPLSVVRSPVGGFLKTSPELTVPDVQYYAAQASADDPQDFNIVSCLSRPKSRGTITLRSNDPFDYPIIQPNYLENEDDLAVFVESVKFIRELTDKPSFRKVIKSSIDPPAIIRTNPEIQMWLRDHIGTSWHYCGTCKMGVDHYAVVNPELQVIGLDNVRVVDASIMPEIIGGNINAAVIMIAEKSADSILKGN